jgi:hypothetical protein
MTIASSAPPSACDSVLIQAPAAYVGKGSMVAMDGRAMEWAACLHERTMAKLTGSVFLLGQMEDLHEDLLAGHRAVGDLLWLQTHSNGYMHVENRDHVEFERDFARLVDVHIADSVQASNPEIQARVAQLRNEVLSRLERPSRWDLGTEMIWSGVDSTAALRKWQDRARPLIRQARGGSDLGGLYYLELVAGEVKRLLGDPERQRRDVEEELEVVRQKQAEGKFKHASR